MPLPKPQIESFTDEQLAAAALADPEIYGILAERHRHPLQNFIYHRLVPNHTDAEDVVQETLVRAFINLRSFDPSRKWKTWLYKVAINCAYNFLRQPKVEPLELSEYFAIENSPEAFAAASLQAESVRSAIARLSPDLQAIFKLSF